MILDTKCIEENEWGCVSAGTGCGVGVRKPLCTET